MTKIQTAVQEPSACIEGKLVLERIASAVRALYIMKIIYTTGGMFPDDLYLIFYHFILSVDRDNVHCSDSEAMASNSRVITATYSLICC